MTAARALPPLAFCRQRAGFEMPLSKRYRRIARPAGHGPPTTSRKNKMPAVDARGVGKAKPLMSDAAKEPSDFLDVSAVAVHGPTDIARDNGKVHADVFMGQDIS